MTFLDITNEEYHAKPGVSASKLKSMARGWRTFQAEHITKTAPRKETPAMALGTAVHTALLEPGRFDAEYVACPPECSDRRTNAYKAWFESIDDMKVLSQEDLATIKAIEESVCRDEFASQLLSADGHVEKSLEWTENDVLCRMRFDKIAGPFCIDIKTCQDATPEAFAKTIASYRYDLQASHYISGLGAIAFGWGVRFVFIAVETCVPYRVRCYEMCDDDFDKANDDRVSLLAEYRRRLESNDWSEPGEGVLTKVFLPNWFSKREAVV